MNNYFYLDANGKQQGPIPSYKLIENGVKPNTLVWCTGMSDWQRAQDVVELKSMFGNSNMPPEPPNPFAADDLKRDYESLRNSFRNSLPAGCPDTHMVGAIIVTVLSFVLGCSLLGTLAGIMAIYKADRVKTFYRLRQYDDAELASNSASRWIKYSIILLILTRLLWFVIAIVCAVCSVVFFPFNGLW